MKQEQIEALYTHFHTPLHVQYHCAAVAEFAVQMADRLIAKEIPIDRETLRDAALLHDVVRYVDFKELAPQTWNYSVKTDDVVYWEEMRELYKGRDHAEVGAELLSELGFTKIAALVRTHNFLQITKGFDSWEAKLLYYADKRAKHDMIVSLAERLEDGKRRNMPHLLNDPAASRVDEKVFALEREIFQAMGTEL